MDGDPPLLSFTAGKHPGQIGQPRQMGPEGPTQFVRLIDAIGRQHRVATPRRDPSSPGIPIDTPLGGQDPAEHPFMIAHQALGLAIQAQTMDPVQDLGGLGPPINEVPHQDDAPLRLD